MFSKVAFTFPPATNGDSNFCTVSPTLLCLFFVNGLFRAAPTARGGSQDRGRIGATAASLHRSHSNARS